jgi:hypothetical protein
MEKFIAAPNLPEGNVSCVIADGRVRDSILHTLRCSGIDVILTDRCDSLYNAVSFHPDMFIHHLGGNDIVAAPNSPAETIKKLSDRGVNIIRGGIPISRNYPGDIAYNVARIGEYAVCNISHTDRVLLSCLSDLGVRLIDVKQGYSKCSICVVDENSVITSDEGIYRSLFNHDIEVLRISPGLIELPGLNYGFIGGTSGFISAEYLSFAGNILLHPDFKKIEKFLFEHGKKIKMLDDGKLLDVGTLIPLKEYLFSK